MRFRGRGGGEGRKRRRGKDREEEKNKGEEGGERARKRISSRLFYQKAVSAN